jgi:hypothetical protein
MQTAAYWVAEFWITKEKLCSSLHTYIHTHMYIHFDINGLCGNNGQGTCSTTFIRSRQEVAPSRVKTRISNTFCENKRNGGNLQQNAREEVDMINNIYKYIPYICMYIYMVGFCTNPSGHPEN